MGWPKKTKRRYIRKSWHKPRGGRKAGSCKLTIPQVRYIKKVLAIERRLGKARGLRHRTKGIYVRLGAKFGVSKWTIKRIAKRRGWPDIKTPDIRVEIAPSSFLARSSVHFLPDIRPRRGGSSTAGESREVE